MLLLMRSQPDSIAWTVTSGAAFYHGWSYTEHSDLSIRCDMFYINIVCPYDIYIYIYTLYIIYIYIYIIYIIYIYIVYIYIYIYI